MKKMNKQILVYLIISFLFFNGNFTMATENNPESLESQLSFTLIFDQPVVKTVNDQGQEYQTLGIPDLPTIHNQQNISVPVRSLRLLLPYATTVDTIQIESLTNPQYYPINLVKQEYISINTFHTNSSLLTVQQLNQSDNNSSVVYENLGIQYVRGYPVLHLNIYPVSYQNDLEIATFYEKMIVQINTKDTSVNTLLRNTAADKKEVLQLIDNPETMQSYDINQNTVETTAQYDYVIITTEALKNANGAYSFNDLISLRESQGLSCTYKTVESIYDEFEGRDEKEKIRNFIKDSYQNWGISWVLLGGDIEHVPIRYLWDFDGQDTVVSSDLYYQCLDGNYNFNGDGRWGEKYDGVNGERIDLYAEVYIGRAPVDDEQDVSSFVEKTIIYENSQWGVDEYLQNHLSVGEFTWDGPGGWGAGYVERCIDYCTDYNHATHGISSQTYNIIKLYERDSSWAKQDMIQAINDGVSIINHVGHGSYSAAMKIYNSDITSLENEGMYSLLYSQACHSGQVEKQDCFAEEWVTAEKKGGFAAIMNSGVGYGGSINYDGADNRYAREFFDALYSNQEQISSIGKANQDSKEDNFWRIEEIGMHMYHVYYNTNLFGDPYLKIKGSEGTIADFRWTPTYAETNDLVQFEDESIGDIISWEWRFGDGHSSSTQNPTHTYHNPGEYTVKLTIMDTKGYRISTSKEIEVRDFWSPIANTTYNYHGSNEFTLAFSGNESFDPDGYIVNWTWDFDDGTMAHTSYVVHEFPDYGEYEVRLILEDDEGNIGSHLVTVDISPISAPDNPVVTGTTGGISETLYYFYVSTIDPQQLVVKYCWDWGDGSPLEWTDYTASGIECRKSHQWMEPGTYSIRVKAKNVAGKESDWSDLLKITIVENTPPIIQMVTPSNGIYIKGQRIFPFFRPIIFGDITLNFSVVDGNGIEQVELFINGNKIYTFTDDPYTYVWQKDSITRLRNKVEVIAYDNSGKMTEERFYVYKF